MSTDSAKPSWGVPAGPGGTATRTAAPTSRCSQLAACLVDADSRVRSSPAASCARRCGAVRCGAVRSPLRRGGGGRKKKNTSAALAPLLTSANQAAARRPLSFLIKSGEKAARHNKKRVNATPHEAVTHLNVAQARATTPAELNAFFYRLASKTMRLQLFQSLYCF